RLWELSPHHASLEEAYMRLTQAEVDYRSTADSLEGFEEPDPFAEAPPEPAAPGADQPAWYAPHTPYPRTTDAPA
ncbi:ABC transporter ATP-binding protein, partial [Streptomyces sp. SID11233]|nr:ABC transporter ATP-binding protein [Streptomyces sp. SID11233]